MSDALVDVAARCLRKTPTGELFFNDDDVREIVDASVQLGNGTELVEACSRLLELGVFLQGKNGSRAAATIATDVFALLARRFLAAAGADRLRERAQKLAELSAEGSTTGGAMNRPSAKGIGLRRKR